MGLETVSAVCATEEAIVVIALVHSVLVRPAVQKGADSTLGGVGLHPLGEVAPTINDYIRQRGS